MKSNKGQGEVLAVIVVALLIIILAGAGLWGCPKYNVWQQGLAGEAELARAEQNRKIAVQEAQAKLESAKLLGNAEVERARGTAEANKIIGESLQGNEAYLRYLWIRNLETAADQQGTSIIYVPTEGGLPILEANRLKK